MVKKLESTASPTELGFHMPAEWEPHAATWIAWPHRCEDWPGKFAAIGWVYAEIVRHLHQSEHVCILVNDTRQQLRAEHILVKQGIELEKITFHCLPTDRVWTRDYGPLFIRNDDGEVAVTDWKFNGWAKYADWRRDDAIPGRIARKLRLRSWKPAFGGQRIVLEGGSLDVNGCGMLLTTEECLLDRVQARNPGLGKKELEHVFAEYLGIKKVLWLGRGIVGDDTHGHVDDIARFVGPGRVVAAVEENSADKNFLVLQVNWNRLQDMTDLEGNKLELIPLPMPRPVWFAAQRLPASYANFYIATDRVLVPTFNDPNDRRALGILADLFPDRLVVGIHAVDLVWGLGTLHCLTQQQPRAAVVGLPP
jgi:agmatine deiminase